MQMQKDRAMGWYRELGWIDRIAVFASIGAVVSLVINLIIMLFSQILIAVGIYQLSLLAGSAERMLSSITGFCIIGALCALAVGGPKRRAVTLFLPRAIWRMIFRKIEVQTRPAGYEESRYRDARDRALAEAEEAEQEMIATQRWMRQNLWRVAMEMDRNEVDTFIVELERRLQDEGSPPDQIMTVTANVEQVYADGLEEREAFARQRENRERRSQGLQPLPEQPGDAELIARFIKWQSDMDEFEATQLQELRSEMGEQGERQARDVYDALIAEREHAIREEERQARREERRAREEERRERNRNR